MNIKKIKYLKRFLYGNVDISQCSGKIKWITSKHQETDSWIIGQSDFHYLVSRDNIITPNKYAVFVGDINHDFKNCDHVILAGIPGNKNPQSNIYRLYDNESKII